MTKKKILLACIILICFYHLSSAQHANLKVLFLGNSYTEYNNLPKLLSSMALSTGDTILTDANTPGGHTLMGHSNNATSLAKINSQAWDFVVLQDQSQLPSFPEADVQEMVYPFARKLDSLIHLNNACTQTVFYMTWGRKNGDAQNCPTWPPVCTYAGMDSLLALRYRKMADDNKALLSPVGAVWKYLRANNPSVELYNPDESHPSLAGSYAAACCFYTLMLKKDPTLITYNGGLTASQATAIKEATKLIVYQQLSLWNVGFFDPKASFTQQALDLKTVQFQNTSSHADSYVWDFGDGDTSAEVNPNHTYKTSGKFVVTLVAKRCNLTDTNQLDIVISSTGITQIQSGILKVYPNPAHSYLQIDIPPAFIGSSYQIFDNFGKQVLHGKLPETDNGISLETLAAGIYHLRVGSTHHKIIKQ
jgi:hypothetical protein